MDFFEAEKPSLSLASFWLVPLSVAGVVLNFWRTRSSSRSWGYIHVLLNRMMTSDSLSLHHYSFWHLRTWSWDFCVQNFKNTLGVWVLILSCSYLLLHSNSGVGCLSSEPWSNVAHSALGCSDVYGMLQKVLVVLCHVRSHTLEHDHKMSSQRVLSVFLWKSLVPYLFPLYTFCSVFVYWGSPILWKGCCLSIISASNFCPP
jgi:hypothetical protein